MSDLEEPKPPASPPTNDKPSSLQVMFGVMVFVTLVLRYRDEAAGNPHGFYTSIFDFACILIGTVGTMVLWIRRGAS